MTTTKNLSYRRVYLEEGEAQEAWEIVGETASLLWQIDEHNQDKSITKNRDHRERAMKIAGSALATLREVLDFITADEAKALVEYAIGHRIPQSKIDRIEKYARPGGAPENKKIITGRQ